MDGTEQAKTIDIDAVLETLKQADAGVADRVLTALETAFQSNAVQRDSLRRSRLLITGALSQAPIQVADASGLSPLHTAIGTPSADGSCVLGHNGYLYLTEGSNYVLSRYDREKASSEDLARRWCTLFDERAKRQRDAGRLFMEFIVPEKISAVPEHLPFPLRTPTDLLSLIEQHFRSEAWRGMSVPVLDLFRIGGDRSFARIDSHQNAFGSYLIANHVANLFGYHDLYGLPFNQPAVRSGDLAQRFFGTPLYEVAMEPDLSQYPVLQVNPQQVEVYTPPEGLTSTRYVWRNLQAPLKIKVVVFGNSCFERGGFPLISWWFGRLFEEFHFVWSSVVDDAYADSIRADLVVGQTMERFLFVHEVPAA